VQSILGFCSGEHLGVFVVVMCCSCFEFGSVWRSVDPFGDLGGFLAKTSLPGVFHQPDRCWLVDSRLVFRCILGSVRLEVGS
jgi:hypothetical protein